jgi:hypothetical protein
MANAGLSLPTEIAWERLCASRDMMDQGTCDADRPAKWNSSLALFRYEPDDEHQIYPGRRITYLKLVCTITGFQPKDREIEGRLNFGGISSGTIEHLDELLESYLPCHGALIQVTVGPKPRVRLPLEQYPYIMDFQPKKRELYETGTETGEFMSRSLESLNIRTAGGTTESAEVLDIDQGFNVGVTGGAGEGRPSLGIQYGRQGQWGTKHLSSGQSDLARTTDEARERRETLSHTTQLTQMRHLFEGYHLGTNRALFFVQPRPHILEEPSGFVRGPRLVEGIQEILLIVNHPEDERDFCVSVRLDTSHLTMKQLKDYDRRVDLVPPCIASVNPPSQEDPARQPAPDETIQDGPPLFTKWYYSCFNLTANASRVYRSPYSDYKIDVNQGGGYRTVENIQDNGTTRVEVSPDGETLTITCEATAHACYFRGCTGIICNPAANEISLRTGTAKRTVVANLISREKIVPRGTQQQLLITTRGLCCCPGVTGPTKVEAEGVVDYVVLGAKAVPEMQQRNPVGLGVAELAGAAAEPYTPAGGVAWPLGAREPQPGSEPSATAGTTGAGGMGISPAGLATGQPGTGRGAARSLLPGRQTAVPGGFGYGEGGATAEGPGESAWPGAGVWPGRAEGSRWDEALAPPLADTPPEPDVMTVAEADRLIEDAAAALIRSGARRLRSEPGEVIPVVESEYFSDQLLDRVSSTAAGRALLRQPAADLIPAKAVKPLTTLFGRELSEVTRGEISEIPLSHLARIAGLKPAAASQLRLALLGVPMEEPPPTTTRRKGRSEGSTRTRKRSAPAQD